MTIGTEHEYSINDARFTPLPVSDRIIREIRGSTESEILFGDVKLGKELQKHVLEFVPRSPEDELLALERQVVSGIRKFYHIFKDRYRLLGLGMHPTLRLDQTAVWDHDECEYYRSYDRLFSIRQHGWLNIQSLQVNLSYADDRDLVLLFNRIRSLIPYLVAVTASSPMVEGALTGTADNRLVFYRKNQREIPLICNDIIPEKIRRVSDYRAEQKRIFSALRQKGAGNLCEEWVNSGGVIVRFSRRCLEIKALDAQECVRSDMAVCAFVQSLLRCPVLSVETDRDALLPILGTAILHGTKKLRPELLTLYERAYGHATPAERQYLPVIKDRIEHGSLAELMRDRCERDGGIIPTLSDMSDCLRDNSPYPPC